MTKSKTLTLDHECLMQRTLSELPVELSEYCYANLFLFRETHNYEVVETEAGCIVKGHSYDEKKFIFPLFAPSPENLAILTTQLVDADMLFPIPEQWLYLFSDKEFRIECHEDDSDYIYQTVKMADLPGRNLSKKRNLISQFNRKYNPQFKLLSADTAEDAVSVLKIWQEQASSMPEEADFEACLDAIKNADLLNMQGFLYYDGDQPFGFVIGKALTPTMFAYHFAKADIRLKGAYQYIFQQTAKLLQSDYEWLNLEQDLGKPSLRKMKKSYLPERMLKKYRIQKV